MSLFITYGSNKKGESQFCKARASVCKKIHKKKVLVGLSQKKTCWTFFSSELEILRNIHREFEILCPISFGCFLPYLTCFTVTLKIYGRTQICFKTFFIETFLFLFIFLYFYFIVIISSELKRVNPDRNIVSKI